MAKFVVLADSHRHLTRNSSGKVIAHKIYKKGDVVEMEEDRASHLIGTGLAPYDESEAQAEDKSSTSSKKS